MTSIDDPFPTAHDVRTSVEAGGHGASLVAGSVPEILRLTLATLLASGHQSDEWVFFTDGASGEYDVVVYCTGYKVTFPFFDPEFISAPDNDLPLFRRVFHPGVPDVFFIGLLQPLGAIMPLAEAQGEWVAQYLHGEYRLPSPEQMRDHIAKDMEAMRKRYVSSKRHTIQVDFDEYLLRLEGERREGARRAAAASYAPQVPAQVQAPEEQAAA